MNKIVLAGTVVEVPKLYLTLKNGKKLYRFFVETERTSENTDILPCVVYEGRLDQISVGKKIHLTGCVFTRNFKENGKRKLDLYVLVYEFGQYEKEENHVEMEGFICKKMYCRKTFEGKTITSFILANNDKNKKLSYYIPTIAWGINAKFVDDSDIGTKLFTVGRLQSRNYKKRISDDKYSIMVAYEYSANTVILLEGEENNGI